MAPPPGGIGPGSVIGGYRIDAVAGDGGMGTVFRATQLSLGRTVALKVIAPRFAADPAFQDRFRRESQLAASLDHPNVVTVFEAGRDGGRLFVSMRFIDGPNLRQLLDAEGPLPPARAVAVVAQVAAALDAAHALGLVHRDVKPANVMIESRGGADHVFLTDFGLVKRVGADPELTGSAGWVGTVDYVAPEQIRGGPADARTDVYALGAVLYTALTGAVPFPREDIAAKLYASVNETMPSVRSIRPELPPGLDAVIATAMAKDPARRHVSAGDLARHAGLAADPPVAAPAVRPAESPSPPSGAALGQTRPHRRRARAALAVASAVAVILAGVGVALAVTAGGNGHSRSAGGAVTGGHSASATTQAPAAHHVPGGPARTMSFRLADSSGGPVTTKVPATPIASTPSSLGGMTLQLYVAQRADPGAALVVFALQLRSARNYYWQTVSSALSANGSQEGSATVSGVSLLDTAGLKEYETFMAKPSDDATCLCSSVGESGVTNNPSSGVYYFAALVAAPPASVTSVSFVTGMGSIANVSLSG